MSRQPCGCWEQFDELAELVADRVAERLRREGTGSLLIDVAGVARRLGVSRDFVYRNAEELGAIRLGEGPRPRLRFDPATVDERFAQRTSRDTTPKPTRRTGRAVRRAPSEPRGLLPVKGEAP